MSFRTDAYYDIHWPDGRVTRTPVQFLKRGEKISQPRIIGSGHLVVETKDSMPKNDMQAITDYLNRIADRLESMAKPRRQVRDARTFQTREQADAVDLERQAKAWHRYFVGKGPKPEPLPEAKRAHVFDSRSELEVDQFLEGARRARKRMQEK